MLLHRAARLFWDALPALHAPSSSTGALLGLAAASIDTAAPMSPLLIDSSEHQWLLLLSLYSLRRATEAEAAALVHIAESDQSQVRKRWVRLRGGGIAAHLRMH